MQQSKRRQQQRKKNDVFLWFFLVLFGACIISCSSFDHFNVYLIDFLSVICYLRVRICMFVLLDDHLFIIISGWSLMFLSFSHSL